MALKKLQEIYGGEIYNGHVIYETLGGWYNIVLENGTMMTLYDTLLDAKDEVDFFNNELNNQNA